MAEISKKKGGRRANSGRKQLNEKDKRIKTLTITLTEKEREYAVEKIEKYKKIKKFKESVTKWELTKKIKEI